jgi:hypothetical protein
VEVSIIRFKFFCCWLIGGRDIGPIVVKGHAIFWVRGYIVTVKILTARLRVVIVIKTRWGNRWTRGWLGGSSTSCRWSFSGWSAGRLSGRRWGGRGKWGWRRIVLPPFLNMLTPRSAAFGWWTILEFFTNRSGFDWVFNNDQVVFGEDRATNVKMKFVAVEAYITLCTCFDKFGTCTERNATCWGINYLHCVVGWRWLVGR